MTFALDSLANLSSTSWALVCGRPLDSSALTGWRNMGTRVVKKSNLGKACGLMAHVMRNSFMCSTVSLVRKKYWPLEVPKRLKRTHAASAWRLAGVNKVEYSRLCQCGTNITLRAPTAAAAGHCGAGMNAWSYSTAPEVFHDSLVPRILPGRGRLVLLATQPLERRTSS